MTHEREAPAPERDEIDLRCEFPLRQDDICGNIIWTADNQRFCDMRGWGYLTGTGGLHLSGEEAQRIQDARGKLIVDAVNDYARLRRELEQARAALEELDTYTESDWGEGLGQRLIRKTLAALQRGATPVEALITPLRKHKR